MGLLEAKIKKKRTVAKIFSRIYWPFKKTPSKNIDFTDYTANVRILFFYQKKVVFLPFFEGKSCLLTTL
jgi:hypothetical protein